MSQQQANRFLVQQQSKAELNAMHQLVDQTDANLRQALEHAAIRHEQLDQLKMRSEEMLNKNENLVFGITNYRRTQERDLFWRRFRYGIIGTVTICLIILLIILSVISKRTSPPSQTIDIRLSQADLSTPSQLLVLTSNKSKRALLERFLRRI